MKLVTLNLRHDADRWEERFPMIVEELLRVDPQVIAFQEIALGIDQAHMIARRLNEGRDRAPYAVYVERKWGAAQQEGIALLTTLPVVDHARVNLPVGGRIAQRLRVVDGGIIDIVNTHLHHLPGDEETVRLPQITRLLDWMYGDEEKCRVLVGDFNATSTSATIVAVKRRLVSAHAAVHQTEPECTFPTPLVMKEGEWYTPRAIDYIFFDPLCLRAEEARLLFTQPHPRDSRLLPSDHYGLLAVLTHRG